ncbi:MAG TPA: response regulator [Spirochaetia bacterium]|nr:response regulator [Spirochaetia bacterium]
MPDTTGQSPTVVLLVDDDDMNLKMFGAILDRAGFATVTAVTGEEALDTARRTRPAVILMDIGLPTIDGLETTRRMKSDPELALIPVIAVTAWASSEDRERAMSAGCVAFLSKPVSMKDLIEAVRRSVGGPGGAGARSGAG